MRMGTTKNLFCFYNHPQIDGENGLHEVLAEHTLALSTRYKYVYTSEVCNELKTNILWKKRTAAI